MCAGALAAVAMAGCSGVPGSAYTAAPSRAAGPVAPAASSAAPKAKDASTPIVAKPSPSPSGPSLVISGAPARVKARESVLADASNGQVLWSKQPGAQRPMASITKVMTAYLVIQSGHLDRTVTVPKGVVKYVSRYGGESGGTHAGEKLTTRDLLYDLMLQSGADAAYTLAKTYGPGMGAFIARMNATARQLGMDHTRFASPDGLPYPTETSTYSTPSDLLVLGETAMKSPVFRSIVGTTQFHVTKGKGRSEHWWYNDDSLLRTYPGADGIKTGFTDTAGHCLLFEATRHGRTLIGVVLGSPATGFSASEDDATKILNWGFSLKKTS
ncbi:MAG: D-alanyl-D-alanine carboxypeptidase [Streptosporangiales bacterium]|nr:D-alanyl-D-alanine carboxypeptidase [Streptosporangiales bacterium]